MDVHELEVFLSVIEPPTIAQAAEKIHLSTGAVTLQLHKLAEDLHTQLFARSGRRLVPTPAALRLAERARGIL